MAIKYSDELEPRRGWLALQTWVIIVGYAIQGRAITFGELAGRHNHPAWFLGVNALGPVAACLEHRLPPITAICVNKETSAPGDGFPGDPHE